MSMFVKYRRESFALKIADSEIFTQFSISNTQSSLVTAATFRKSFVEIVVPLKLILFNLEKNLKGTFSYKAPVLAKLISLHLLNVLIISEVEVPQNTNCHHEKQTAETLTRSCASRFWKIFGQNQAFTVEAIAGTDPLVMGNALLMTRVQQWKAMRKSLVLCRVLNWEFILTFWTISANIYDFIALYIDLL